MTDLRHILPRLLRPAAAALLALGATFTLAAQASELPGQGVKVRPWSDESRVINALVREVAASADPATRT